MTWDQEVNRLSSLPLALAPIDGNPHVSVLVANYNYSAYIGDALESLLRQTYGDFEIIVCDDGSTDDSVDIIEQYERRDSRVTLVRKENGGAASALNRAYEAAKGEVVCLLDADDTFHPAKLSKVVEAFRGSNWGLIVHPLMVVDAAANPIQRKPAFSNFESGWIAADVVRRGGRWNYMEASAVCLRQAVAKLAFPIPEQEFRSWADAYLCTIGAMVAPVGYVDRALADYRIHGSNVSGFQSLNADHGLKAMDGYRRLVDGVNTRLRALGLERVDMRVEDNLGYLESLLQHQLFRPGASIRERLATYGRYSRSVVKDDLYGRVRKALSLFFFGTAFLLPMSARPRWVSAGLTHSRIKQRLLELSHLRSARRDS